jgi:hypothetical protein
MDELAEQPENLEPDANEGLEKRADTPPPDAADVDAPQVPWRKVGAYVGGALTLVVGTVVVTLAATHRTAVRENAAAYLNGVRDGAAWAGILGGDTWDDDDFDDFEGDCPACAGMTLQYCPECHAVDPDA